MTVIEDDTELIVIDPLISAETGKAGLDLARQHLSKQHVIAVTYIHRHHHRSLREMNHGYTAIEAVRRERGLTRACRSATLALIWF